MGQLEPLRAAAEAAPVATIREAVSPWLWAFSLAGFGMTVLNTRRIAKMFRGWKGPKK